MSWHVKSKTMIVLFIIAVALIMMMFIVAFGVPGGKSYLGWRLSGIWANQSDTLQIMIHEEKDCLHGHVVSAQVGKGNERPVVGKMVMDDVKLQPAWKWSAGKYIDPYTTHVYDLKLKMKDGKTLEVRFFEKDSVVRKEEWKLVNSF